MKPTGSGASAVARRYGKALLEVALDQKVDPHAVRKELEDLALRAASHPGVVRVLASPAVSPSRKLALVNALLEGRRLEPIVSNLLRVLAKNDRIPVLSAVHEAYKSALDEQEKIADADVTTPDPLKDGQKKDVEARVSAFTGKTMRVSFLTDPKILGGVVIRTGNFIYDASLVTQLEKLRERVLAGQR